MNEEGLYDQFEKQKLAKIPRREIMYVLKTACIHLLLSSLLDRLLSVVLVSPVILAPANLAMSDKVCGVVQRASLMWL